MKKQQEYIEGFRITRDGESLFIEATDYHAMPLRLDREELAKLGVRLVALPKGKKAGKKPVEDEKEKEREA